MPPGPVTIRRAAPGSARSAPWAAPALGSRGGRLVAVSDGAPGRQARDRQRAAVYAAEEQVGRILARAAEFPVVEIAGSHLAVPAERRFGDVASVQHYVDRVLGLNWVRETWPRAAARPLRVRARRGAAKAHYEPAGAADAVVALPVAGDGWAMRELVVLHELAHHLGCADAEQGDDLTHGPAFTGRLLALVEGIIGAEATLLLRVALADQGVQPG